jgi:hypothetical protein
MNTSGSFQVLLLNSFRLGLNSNLTSHSNTLANSSGNDLTVLSGDLHGAKERFKPDNRIRDYVE